MFLLTTSDVLQFIDLWVREASNIEDFLAGKTGDRSKLAVNHLTMVRDKKVFLCSEAIVKKLAEKAAEKDDAPFFHWCVTQARGNPSWLGWVMEAHVLRPVRRRMATAVVREEKKEQIVLTLYTTNGKDPDYRKEQEIDLHVDFVVEYEEKSSNLNFLPRDWIHQLKKGKIMWILPQKWNQGCYDVAWLRWVDKTDPTDAAKRLQRFELRLYQITLGSKHEVKLHLAVHLRRVVEDELKKTRGATPVHVEMAFILDEDCPFSGQSCWDKRTKMTSPMTRSSSGKVLDQEPDTFTVFRCDFKK
jgi:hypothetical protein